MRGALPLCHRLHWSIRSSSSPMSDRPDRFCILLLLLLLLLLVVWALHRGIQITTTFFAAEGTNWYHEHFYGQPHRNFLGIGRSSPPPPPPPPPPLFVAGHWWRGGGLPPGAAARNYS